MYARVPIKQNRLGAMRSSRSRRIVARRLAALGYDDSGIDWSSIISTGITSAASVAKTAVTPPTYSSVVNPLTGAQTITAYGTAAAPALSTA